MLLGLRFTLVTNVLISCVDNANGWPSRRLPDQVPGTNCSTQQKPQTKKRMCQFTQRPGKDSGFLGGVENVSPHSPFRGIKQNEL